MSGHERPFGALRIDELEQAFASAGGVRRTLMALHAELVRRRTNARVVALTAEVWRSLRYTMRPSNDTSQAERPIPSTASGGDVTFLRQAVARLRDKLIDISKANPLIAFKHAERGASYLRIIDETLDGLHAGLASGRAMRFEPLPDPRTAPADQKTPTFRLALETARLTDGAYLKAMSRAGAELGAADAAEAALVAQVREQLGLPRLASPKTPDLAALARANGFDPSYDLPAEAQGRPSY